MMRCGAIVETLQVSRILFQWVFIKNIVFILIFSFFLFLFRFWAADIIVGGRVAFVSVDISQIDFKQKKNVQFKLKQANKLKTSDRISMPKQSYIMTFKCLKCIRPRCKPSYLHRQMWHANMWIWMRANVCENM